MAKTSTKKAATRASTRRELVETGTDTRYAKRSADGTWKDMDDVSRSLRADTPRRARTAVKPGHGDQGDVTRVVKRAAKKR